MWSTAHLSGLRTPVLDRIVEGPARISRASVPWRASGEGGWVNREVLSSGKFRNQGRLQGASQDLARGRALERRGWAGWGGEGEEDEERSEGGRKARMRTSTVLDRIFDGPARTSRASPRWRARGKGGGGSLLRRVAASMVGQEVGIGLGHDLLWSVFEGSSRTWRRTWRVSVQDLARERAGPGT
eukprot:363964-Chlamydomonas_euryale.AAC.1